MSAIPTLFWGVVTFVDSQFIRGDGNGDLSVNIADPIANLDYQFNLGPVLCFDAYDVNDDGVIDISDPIYNLSYQFTFGPAPLPAALSCD